MQLCLGEIVRGIKLFVRIIAIVTILFAVPFSFSWARNNKSVKKDVKQFFKGYQLMVRNSTDTKAIKNILDTLSVPDYIKEVLEFMAFYSRSILTGDYKLCVRRAKEMLDRIEKEYKGNVPDHHYKWMVGAVNQGYGSCLYYTGDRINSYFAYKQAYEMFSSIKDSTLTGIILTNMATVLIDLKMYDEVLQYYVLAKKYLADDSLRLIPLNINIGAIYTFLDRPDLALRYYTEALMLANDVLKKDTGQLSEAEKQRVLRRKELAQINMASLFLEVAEESSKKHNIEFIKKLKMSLSKLLDSARVLNRQVDTSLITVRLKSAYWDNELKYWILRSQLEESQAVKDSLVKYLLLAREFYEKYGDYNRKGKKSVFIASVENKDLIPVPKEELYRECLEFISSEQQEVLSLASSLTNIQLPTASGEDLDRLLGELPYQCSLKYAVSVGLAVLFGTILVLVAFLYSRGKRTVKG